MRQLSTDRDDCDERGDQPTDSEDDLGAVAGSPGYEGLHQDADHGNAEDDENR
jgi:hypothetical protein